MKNNMQNNMKNNLFFIINNIKTKIQSWLELLKEDLRDCPKFDFAKIITNPLKYVKLTNN